MNVAEVILDGRKYRAYVSNETTSGTHVIIGPPEFLVDSLGLPLETATRLHNILYDRGIMKYEDAAKRGVLPGVMQELFALDAQLLLEKFNEFQKESVV